MTAALVGSGARTSYDSKDERSLQTALAKQGLELS